jgi:hypothetical protein
MVRFVVSAIVPSDVEANRPNGVARAAERVR